MRYHKFSCQNKIAYWTQAEAFQQKQWARRFGTTLQVYKCKLCHRFHCGNKLQKIEKLRFISEVINEK